MITPQEKEHLLNLKAEGKNANELRSALGSFRLGQQPLFETKVGNQQFVDKRIEEEPKDESGFLGRVKEEAVRAGKSGVEAIERGAELMQEGKPIRGAIRSGLGTAASFVRGAFAPLTAAITPVIQKTTEKLSDLPITQAIATSPKVSDALDTIFGGVEKAKVWAEENPDTAKNLIDLIEVGSVITGGKVAKETLEKAVATTGKVVSKTGEFVTKTKTGITETAIKAKDVVLKKATPEEKVLDIISPKLTSKEVRKIISEDRVARGAKGGVKEKLFGSKADLVTQSKQVEKARDTIMRRIENVDKLDDFALNSKLKSEITTIANEIKEPMKAISVTPQQTTSIKGVWDKLKGVQSKRDDFVAFNGKRTQKNFEAYLDSVKKTVKDEKGKFRTKDMNDVWDIRKNYDNSIPDNVKQATTQSPARLQFRKEMWLENRAILNDTINDMSNGLGDLSKKAFSDMSDIYMARQNIATKSKILTDGEKGLLEKNIVKWGLTVGGGTLLGGLAF